MKSIQARLTITFIGLMVALLVIVWGVKPLVSGGFLCKSEGGIPDAGL